ILGGFQSADCAAVGTNERADGSERVQIASDGYCGNRESFDEVSHGDLAILVNQIQKVSSALLSENASSRRHAPFPNGEQIMAAFAEPGQIRESILTPNTFACFPLLVLILCFCLCLLSYRGKSFSREVKGGGPQ